MASQIGNYTTSIALNGSSSSLFRFPHYYGSQLSSDSTRHTELSAYSSHASEAKEAQHNTEAVLEKVSQYAYERVLGMFTSCLHSSSCRRRGARTDNVRELHTLYMTSIELEVDHYTFKS